MASRTSNFCIDAHDPYAQTLWWAQVLDDFGCRRRGAAAVGRRGVRARRPRRPRHDVPQGARAQDGQEPDARVHPPDRPDSRRGGRAAARPRRDAGRRPPQRARPGLGRARRPRGQRVLRAHASAGGSRDRDETQQETLLDYLQTVREAVLWKLDGASDYDVRRPLTPTGSNLLGLVKHLAYVELGYFVSCFGRTMPVPDAVRRPRRRPPRRPVRQGRRVARGHHRALPPGVGGVRAHVRRRTTSTARRRAVVAARRATG